MKGSSDFVSFRTTVCGIAELGDQCAFGVSHVLSILDPAAPEPPVFASVGEHERLELRFDDVIAPMPEQIVPTAREVEEILAFGRGLEAESDAHLLVHCHAGISRSTAAMTLILAQARPDLPPAAVLDEVLRIRHHAWPNLLILEIGDRLLSRRGGLVRAVGAVYRRQLDRRPELAEFFTASGRAREVELALRSRS